MKLVPRYARPSAGFWFALPWMIGVVGLVVVPLAGSGLLSLTRWDGLSWEVDLKWVGLGNYREILTDDPLFRRALGNSLYYALIGVPLSLAASLGVAVLLAKPIRGIGLFRTLFYLPHVLGGVATVVIWSWLFNPRFGPINAVLSGCFELLDPLVRLFNGEGTADWQAPNWFYSPMWCKPAWIVMQVWSFGGAMLIFLAALRHVPNELHEAAALDGAGRWRRFRHVTWPAITPALLFNLVTGLVLAMQAFHQAYLLGHRSQDDGLLFYVLYLYRCAFEPPYRVGYSAALGWIFFAVVFVLVLAAVRSARGWVFYGGDR
ncbi:MAG: sugar ABC transporter permease [Planctomycetes bacterium]|nr:sugar ABC transporter permease [Planctomycetota bacterium]